MPLSDGATFAGFAIVRRLGAGGMGDVYLVQHPRLPRLQALRILPIELSADAEFRARFQREADLVASLSHPNIVGVHDRGESDGQLWILMGFVDGIDAARLLRERYPEGMPRAEAMAIIAAIAEALDYAHERGLVHRNVKPANILLTDPGTAHSRILLADLGIARQIKDASRLTATDLDYIAPEYLLDLPYEGRADQYSLAATAYHLLVGVKSRQLNSPSPKIGDVRPELADLDAALSRALAKDPGARFPRCQDLAVALRGETASQPGTAPAPAAAPTAPPEPTLIGTTPGAPTPSFPPPVPATYGQPWPAPAQPPPRWPLQPPRHRDRRWWVVGAAAIVMLAIVVTVAVLTQAGRHSAGSPAVSSSPTVTAAAASAGDTGTVGIITEDPTCITWTVVGQTWLASAPVEHWDTTHPGQKNPLLISGSAWTPDESAVMQATAKATRLAAVKTAPLISTTPHRVMRELYEQFVVYARAFADIIGPKYFPPNAALGGTTESLFNALVSICTTAETGAAKARAALVSAPDAPSNVAAPQDPANLQRFLATGDLAACGDVTSASKKFQDNPTFKDWDKSGGSQSTPQQKALNDAVAPLMLNLADDIQQAVGRSNNPVMLDFGTLLALYQRVFAKALPTYSTADSELEGAATYLRYTFRDGCAAVGS